MIENNTKKKVFCNNDKCVLNPTCNTYAPNRKKNVIKIFPLLRRGNLFKNYFCNYYVNKNQIGQGKI